MLILWHLKYKHSETWDSKTQVIRQTKILKTYHMLKNLENKNWSRQRSCPQEANTRVGTKDCNEPLNWILTTSLTDWSSKHSWASSPQKFEAGNVHLNQILPWSFFMFYLINQNSNGGEKAEIVSCFHFQKFLRGQDSPHRSELEKPWLKHKPEKDPSL